MKLWAVRDRIWTLSTEGCRTHSRTLRSHKILEGHLEIIVVFIHYLKMNIEAGTMRISVTETIWNHLKTGRVPTTTNQAYLRLCGSAAGQKENTGKRLPTLKSC